MFKEKEQSLKSIVMQVMRQQGLETPLLQRRLIASWPLVVGEEVAKRTTKLSIYNQTLYVSLDNCALRADLNIRRKALIEALNRSVNSQVITHIRFC